MIYLFLNVQGGKILMVWFSRTSWWTFFKWSNLKLRNSNIPLSTAYVENALSQPDIVHLYGLSPVWILKWVFKIPFSLKAFEQSATGHL